MKFLSKKPFARQPSPPLLGTLPVVGLLPSVGGLNRTLAVLGITPRIVEVALLLAACFVGQRVLGTEYHDPFETPETAWQLMDRDCPSLRVLMHSRVYGGAHQGSGCEYIRIAGDLGTYVYYAVEVPAATVIDELSITLWVRSTRPGIQLLARVVLPNTRRSSDSQPVTTLLRGTAYQQVGQWQALQITEPLRQLRRQEPSLRFEHGPALNIRDAFVDAVVVNAYGGRGETELWLDDLHLTGIVSPKAEATKLGQAQPQSSLRKLTVRGDLILAAGAPQCLRAIEYNGEPWHELAAMGFNAVWLSRSATSKELRAAAEAGLYVVAPDVEAEAASQPYIVAWVCCTASGNTAPTTAADRTGRLVAGPTSTESPVSNARPIFMAWPGSSAQDTADITVVEVPTIGSGYEMTELGAWLRRKIATVAQGRPVAVVLPSQPPQVLRTQLRAMGVSDNGLWCEPEQLRLMAFHSLASGARAILWRSHEPLTRPTAADRLRRKQLEWLNREIEWLEPFFAAGRASGPLHLGHPGLLGFSIETERALLAILLQRGAEQQLCVPAYRSSAIRVTLPTTSTSPRIYQLTTAGLVQLPAVRVAGGVEVSPEHFGYCTFLVVANEPLVLRHLAEKTTPLRRLQAEAMVETLAACWTSVQETLQAIGPTADSSRELSPLLASAGAALEQSQRMLGAGEYRGMELYVYQGLRSLAQLRRTAWEPIARQYPAANASPTCALFSCLPQHASLQAEWRSRSWSANVLPEGDMEDLQRMLVAGWQRRDVSSHGTAADVGLIEVAARSGHRVLHIGTQPDKQSAAAIAITDQPLVEIVTPPLPMEPGQVVHVRGWARVHAASTERAALVIYDSWTGPELAVRLPPTATWIPWSIYRAAPQNGVLRVSFAVEGHGEAWIDDVTAHILVALPSGN